MFIPWVLVLGCFGCDATMTVRSCNTIEIFPISLLPELHLAAILKISYQQEGRHAKTRII